MTAARERSITVFGLPSTTDDNELRRLFSVFGSIVSTQVMPEPHGSQRRGFVTFRTPEAAEAAKASMQGHHHRGASIHVRMACYVEGGYEVPESEGGIVRTSRTRIYDSRCFGTVHLWKGLYGWIEADTRINHPTAGRHEGRVFVDNQDVDGFELTVGDRVSFYAYVDSEGIGGEDVRLQGRQGGRGTSSSSTAPPGEAAVVVDGWPPSLDKASFRQTFEEFGTVSSVEVYPPKQQGSRSTGRVVFTSLRAAEMAAQSLDGKLYGAKPLQVALDCPAVDEADSPDGSSELPAAAGPGIAAPAPSARRRQVPGSAGAVLDSEDAAGPVITSDTRLLGTVKAWKGRFGWIIPDRKIPQGKDEKHRGWVYADARDLEDVSELRVGDRVSFVVYKDNLGIGGSKVRVERDGGAMPPERAAQAEPAPQAERPHRWWHELAGDCCPISLTSFEELEYEPFGLLGSKEDADASEFEGLWGSAAMAALLSMKAVHWFDGRFLACSLVSKGQLVDPVSMRPLVREECASLDRYLASNGLPAVNVAEAFDLAQAIAKGGNPAASERLESLGHEAASLVRIFDEEPAASGASAEALLLKPAQAAAAAAAPAGSPSPTAAAGGSQRRRRWGQGR